MVDTAMSCCIRCIIKNSYSARLNPQSILLTYFKTTRYKKRLHYPGCWIKDVLGMREGGAQGTGHGARGTGEERKGEREHGRMGDGGTKGQGTSSLCHSLSAILNKRKTRRIYGFLSINNIILNEVRSHSLPS